MWKSKYIAHVAGYSVPYLQERLLRAWNGVALFVFRKAKKNVNDLLLRDG